MQKHDKEIIVRPFVKTDIDKVRELDDLSGNYVSQWIEELDDNEISDFGYGLFKDNILIGYCTIGGADDVSQEIQMHPDYTYESLYLSDVFILPAYRKSGLAIVMLNSALEQANKDGNAVYLTVMYDKLSNLYEKIGFALLGNNGCMAKERLEVKINE